MVSSSLGRTEAKFLLVFYPKSRKNNDRLVFTYLRSRLTIRFHITYFPAWLMRLLTSQVSWSSRARLVRFLFIKNTVDYNLHLITGWLGHRLSKALATKIQIIEDLASQNPKPKTRILWFNLTLTWMLILKKIWVLNTSWNLNIRFRTTIKR